MKKIYSIFMFLCVLSMAQTTYAVFNTNEVATGEEKVENVYLLKKTLKPGLIDDEVVKLQNVLIASGYLSLPTKSLGYYGPETVTAVKKLQADNGIETVGTVGPKTITTINTLLSKVPETSGDITTSPAGVVIAPQTSPTNYTFSEKMGLGAKGTEVTNLQNYLRSQGYFKGPSTGYFGFQTREALSQYQRANKVNEYGSVGPRTVRVLNGEKIEDLLDITQRELSQTGTPTTTTTGNTTPPVEPKPIPVDYRTDLSKFVWYTPPGGFGAGYMSGYAKKCPFDSDGAGFTTGNTATQARISVNGKELTKTHALSCTKGIGTSILPTTGDLTNATIQIEFLDSTGNPATFHEVIKPKLMLSKTNAAVYGTVSGTNKNIITWTGANIDPASVPFVSLYSSV